MAIFKSIIAEAVYQIFESNTFNKFKKVNPEYIWDIDYKKEKHPIIKHLVDIFKEMEHVKDAKFVKATTSSKSESIYFAFDIVWEHLYDEEADENFETQVTVRLSTHYNPNYVNTSDYIFLFNDLDKMIDLDSLDDSGYADLDINKSIMYLNKNKIQKNWKDVVKDAEEQFDSFRRTFQLLYSKRKK